MALPPTQSRQSTSTLRRTCNDETIFVEVDIESKLSDQVLRMSDVFKVHSQLRVDADQTRVQLETISDFTTRVSIRLQTDTILRNVITFAKT